jgi:LysM repeat protein
MRLLAPLALVVTAIAFIAVVTSGGGGDGNASSSGTPTPAATSTAAAHQKPKKKAAQTYVVQAGDTPSSIAEAKGIDVKALLAANPDIDPVGLHVGQKLKLP